MDDSFSNCCGHTYLLREISASPHLASWITKALSEISQRLSDDDFPCLFGRKSWKDSSAKVLFCEEYEHFLTGLTEYTNFVKKTKIEERLLTPLVAFFSEQLHRGKRQHSTAWEVLNWVHLREPEEWPRNVPTDPEHPEWSFCFNGVQLFINFSSRDHQHIKSRNLGSLLTMVINPRENFDLVASANTKSGRLIRERIRSRVAHYNGGLVPEELGQYGDKDNREWKQYQVSEKALPRPSQCPMQIISAEGRADKPLKDNGVV